MPLHVAIYVCFVATIAGTKEFRRLAAFIFDVTIETVLPFVFTFAHFARPWLVFVAVVNHTIGCGL